MEKGRYEAVVGFNTKQWWVYDSELDVYIDPPEEVLDTVPDWRTDSDAGEAKLLEIVAQEPDWLTDAGYWYEGEI